ncbi:MAG: hypothetical protein K2H64_12750 [Desulfovibrio sp.]|nr:hypothetical protein [Desulfovibrio sp.]
MGVDVDSAWKKADAAFLREMKDAVMKAWDAYNKLEGHPAALFKEKEQEYDSIKKIMLEAAKSAARVEDKLTFSDDQFSINGVDLSERLTLDLNAKSRKGSPEFTLSYDPVQDELKISATANRGGLTQKKCDPLVKAFLDNRVDAENKYYNYR